MTLEERLQSALEGAVYPIGLAVSGGSDSLAMLKLVSTHVKAPIFCATVNHGLRTAAVAECDMVSRLCNAWGIAHDTLHWSFDGRGNLQAAAREGRYASLAAWARSRGVETVLLGHTQDDVAETFLMRMARGSGVKGLARMQPAWQARGINWRRPLLTMSRHELRDYLRASGLIWAEDASNKDARFDRVKVRAALADCGLDAAKIAETSERLAHADEALEVMAIEASRRVAHLQGRNIIVDVDGLFSLPVEIVHRLLSAWCAWQGRTEYPPRREAIATVIERILSGKSSTLNGCIIVPHRGRVIVAREAQCVVAKTEQRGMWDGLSVQGDRPDGATLGALGEEGLRALAEWRSLGLPRAALTGSVAVWLGTRLIAAPALGLDDGFVLKFETEPPYLTV